MAILRGIIIFAYIEVIWQKTSEKFSPSAQISFVLAAQNWEQRPGSSHYYYLSTSSSDGASSWHESRAWCMENGADLVSIHSPQERDWLVEQMTPEFHGDFWIGLNNLMQTGWRWSDNTNMDHTDWRQNYPVDDAVGWQCAYTRKDPPAGYWLNDKCGEKKAFICKRTSSNTSPRTDSPTNSVGGYCPRDYVGTGNKCFKMVKIDLEIATGFTWDEALTRCRSEGSEAGGLRPDLASVHNPQEAATVNQMIQSHHQGMWLGLRRENFSSPWTWSDNSALDYTTWGPNEPQGTADHCAEVWITPGPPGTWNNLRCDHKRGYICQTFKNPSGIINTPPMTTPGVCTGDYSSFWNACYRLVTGEKSWTDADAFCKQDGGNLVSIHHESENSNVFLITRHLNKPIWIGLNDRVVRHKHYVINTFSTRVEIKTEGLYYWTDNWHVVYTKWASGQPLKPEGGGCVAMANNGAWADSVCDTVSPFVCKKTSELPNTTPPNIDGDCPADDNLILWKKFGRHCYGTGRHATKNFQDAQDFCKLKGGSGANLASVHYDIENEFARQLAYSMSASWQRGAWIGMRKNGADDAFFWMDLNPVEYTNWAPGEPNDVDGSEQCVEIYLNDYKGGWNDFKCDTHKPFVCKVEKVIPPTTPPPRPPSGGDCPGQDWINWGSDCLKIYPDEYATFNEARTDCEMLGAVLATIPDHPTNWYVHKYLTNGSTLPMDRHYWVGLYRNNTSTPWEWVDGSQVRYENWEAGQPESSGGKFCTEMHGGGNSRTQWRTTTCDRRRGFVCKTKKSVAPGPNVPDSRDEKGKVAGIVIGVIGACLLISALVIILVRMGKIKGIAGSTNDFAFNNVLYNTRNNSTSVNTNNGNRNAPGRMYADLEDSQTQPPVGTGVLFLEP